MLIIDYLKVGGSLISPAPSLQFRDPNLRRNGESDSRIAGSGSRPKFVSTCSGPLGPGVRCGHPNLFSQIWRSAVLVPHGDGRLAVHLSK